MSTRWVVRIGAGVALLAGLVLVGRNAGGVVQQFAGWVEGLGVWGPAAFVMGYAVATVAFAPGSLLTLAAGVVFGLVAGAAYAFAGAMLGASAAFLVARYLARDAVERRLEGNRRFAAIDQAIGREGRKIVLLLRLSPVVPFNLLNYALGLSGVRFRDYAIASAGILPGTILYVYYGTLLRSVAEIATDTPVGRDTGYYVLLGLGLVATIAATAVVTRVAQRALAEATGGEVGRG